MLSDRAIEGRVQSPDGLDITPFVADNIEPASVDLRLGDDFKRVFKEYSPKERVTVSLDEGNSSAIGHRQIEERPVILEPGELILATTKEKIHMPDDLTAKVLGRSSLGRLGVSVHQTAGFIDPGFVGEITLELSNSGPIPVELTDGLRVCQIVFSALNKPAKNSYGGEGSQYQYQVDATESGMNFE